MQAGNNRIGAINLSFKKGNDRSPATRGIGGALVSTRGEEGNARRFLKFASSRPLPAHYEIDVLLEPISKHMKNLCK